MKRIMALLLALALLLTCAACGGKNTASTMSLTKTEGDVEVTDDNDKDVSVREDLRLYSGYQVRTRKESYAWIDLDAVKLAKLDQSSRVELEKDGKVLELSLRSGSVFFNVTEPLEEDESMTIRTSTMAVGIRGTCGWVECGDDTTRVYILEGKVRCRAGGAESVNVSAGEMAELKKGGMEIRVAPFTQGDIPAFVWDEVEDEDELLEAVGSGGGGGDTSGWEWPTVPGWGPQTGGEETYTWGYDSQGRVCIINVYNDTGELRHYTVTYTAVAGGTWVDVECYDPDGELDNWDSFNSLEEFYAAYRDMLPEANGGDPGMEQPSADLALWQEYYLGLLDLLRNAENAREYYLYDINKDGTPELIAAYHSGSTSQPGSFIQVYTFQNGQSEALVLDGVTDTPEFLYDKICSYPEGNGLLFQSDTFRGLYTLSILRMEGLRMSIEELGSYDDHGVYKSIHDFSPGTAGLPRARLDDIAPILNYTAPGPAGSGTLPTDGDRIVFTGTVNTYTFDEVIALQGLSDEDARAIGGRDRTYELIVLDEPIDMVLRSGDPTSFPLSQRVSIVAVSGMEQYDGQHLIFSLDLDQTERPTDVSLPLNEPRSSDVHVLGQA